ncbi:MAG: hypothetical protein H0U44_02940 [Flavisolibacter sp.]|jgi:hypothetical protein|nr:hypothetical protein [Flavisolibacter sp.]
MKTLFLICLSFFSFQLSAQQNTQIQRAHFSLTHPASWTIDKTDPDYDPDGLFTLQSPDSTSMVMFILLNVFVENSVMLEAQIKEFKSQLIRETTSETPFTTWGALKGNGIILRGKLMGVLPGAVRIFTWNNKEKSMVIIEQYFDEGFENIKNDYKLIESSFKFL